jgi:DNA-binding transcriptional ArsR family regulator
MAISLSISAPDAYHGAMNRPHRSGAEPRAPRVPELAQMRALAHPLRLRIMELFTEQPRTTKQVAELLGEPPTRLYHHVAALDRAGLLRLTETRKKRGTLERWYEAVVRTLRTPHRSEKRRPKSKESAARRAIALTVLEQSRQELVAAMHRSRGNRPILARLVMVAPRDRVSALRKRLFQVIRDVQRDFGREHDAQPNPEDERWALTMTFTPILRVKQRGSVDRG